MTKPQQDWETRFDEKFPQDGVNISPGYAGGIKDFISDLLSQQREEMPDKQNRSWEEEYNEFIRKETRILDTDGDIGWLEANLKDLDKVKGFIRQKLSQQRKEFVKTHKELFDCKLKLKEE